MPSPICSDSKTASRRGHVAGLEQVGYQLQPEIRITELACF
jgi:hypothetical protein